jgi:hypothetical protein
MSKHNHDMLHAADRPTITPTSTRLYTCRDQLKRLVNPDGNYIDNEYDDHKRLTKTKIDGSNEYNALDYCLCGPIITSTSILTP